MEQGDFANKYIYIYKKKAESDDRSFLLFRIAVVRRRRVAGGSLNPSSDADLSQCSGLIGAAVLVFAVRDGGAPSAVA